MYASDPSSFTHLKTRTDWIPIALINLLRRECLLTRGKKWRNEKRCSTTGLLRSTSSRMSSSKTSHHSTRKYPPYNHCRNHNKLRLQEVAQNKRESITKTCVLPCIFRERITYFQSGRRIIARQTRRRRRQFQGGPRSPHEEPSGLSITHRKFCFLRFSTFSTIARLTTICVSSVQYSYQIPDATARLPKFESRHIESGSWLVFSVDAKWCAIGPATINDGRSAAAEYVHKYARRSNRHD